ncbi:MAG: hypothetical protein JNK89_11205 [Saprospiraceae bacterium]|nr:hypothetical protein [Saprospiraceae bacterium]
MDEPQEYSSLDELFRKTFDDLPSEASASGWDQPSPRVWEQLRGQIQPPKNGWTTQSIVLIAGMAIVLLLGLYWALAAPKPQSASVAPETTAVAPLVQQDQPAEPADLVGNTTLAIPPALQNAPETSSRKAVSRHSLSSNKPATGTSKALEIPEIHRQLPGSAPLPGTTPASPNTTIRRQLEMWRSAPWAQPLAPLPSILESNFIRPVPESLKNLGN